MPRWAQPSRYVQTWMTGQQKEIGCPFIYRRIGSEKFGEIACSILHGDYGIAAYLMFEYEWLHKFPINFDDIPKDIDELVAQMQNDKSVICDNDPLWPSWL